MPWLTTDLTTVNPNAEAIPEGTYTFSLGGAKYDDRGYNRIEANATIVTEGDFMGRKMFFSYPDPESINSKGKKNDWSAKALKRLEQSLGVDASAGEDPVEYLNRVAGTRFSAPVSMRPATDDYPARPELVIFKVGPAA